MNIKKLSQELSKRKIFHRCEGDFVITKRSKIKIPEPCLDIFYLLGVVAGDGSLSMTKRKKGGFHYIFRIYSGKKYNLDYFNKIFERHFLIKGKINRDKRKQSCFILTFKNSSLFFYFHLLGSEIGKKSRGKIPYLHEKDENFLHYLSGLVDTDGHVSHNRIQLKQKNKKLLVEIKNLADTLGLNCSVPKVNYTNKVPFYYIRFDNKLPLRLK